LLHLVGRLHHCTNDARSRRHQMQEEDIVIFPYTTTCPRRILHLLPKRPIAYIRQSHTSFLTGDTPYLVCDMKVRWWWWFTCVVDSNVGVCRP